MTIEWYLAKPAGPATITMAHDYQCNGTAILFAALNAQYIAHDNTRPSLHLETHSTRDILQTSFAPTVVKFQTE